MELERDRMPSLDGSLVLGPQQLALLREAFDAAWEEVASYYASSPTSIEVGRLQLANAVLAKYRHDTTDAAAIKGAALRTLAAWHPGFLPRSTEATAVGVGGPQPDGRAQGAL